MNIFVFIVIYVWNCQIKFLYCGMKITTLQSRSVELLSTTKEIPEIDISFFKAWLKDRTFDNRYKIGNNVAPFWGIHAMSFQCIVSFNISIQETI